MDKYDIGMIGMGVMGENLAMNMESKGYKVSCYDIVDATITKFINNRGKGLNFKGCYSLDELVNSLKSPRIIMIMIKAGDPVTQTISKLVPLLAKGDIIVDGGNSNYEDTIARFNYLKEKGIEFVGMGVSGGEEGALNGPSLMPGGSLYAWNYIKDIYQAISAKIDTGEACCSYIGNGGAGHYVKMVHNGIEYGDMQLICEVYDILRKLAKFDDDKMSDIFRKWNKGKLDSYLVDITSKILSYKESGSPIVEKILDTAGQKGTGKWASISSLNEGIPLTLISEAVYARCLSAIKDERVEASKVYNKKLNEVKIDENKLIDNLENALYVAKIISYAQGFSLLRTASKTYDWNLNFGNIALTWRGGCIIRSRFLGKINEAFNKNPNLANLLLDDYFKEVIEKDIGSLREICSLAILNGIPCPALTSAISYFDGYTSERLPQNLLQAQRDFFGAHTYERIDAKRGKFFHTNWTGHGGDTTASTYNA